MYTKKQESDDSCLHKQVLSLFTPHIYIIDNNLFKLFMALNTKDMCLCCQFKFKQRKTTGAPSGV